MRFFAMILLSATLLGGCTAAPDMPVHVHDVGIQVREEITIIDPASENFVNWSQLFDQLHEADVILLGEQHDHAVGHAVQLAVVEDVMDKYPRSTLALEMLERDEQLLVDDYMEGVIDENVFEKLTNSTNWGAKDGWGVWYQPIIESVKTNGGLVVAANAPRRYVKLARLEGYDRLDELSVDRRMFVDYPTEFSGGRYRQRFWEFASHNEDDEEDEEINVEELDPDDPMLPFFRSQQAWDATMAQSIVNANPSKEHKVVLLVGQFHVEYDGGIVQELRKRAPHLQVMVISIQREVPEEEWQGNPAIADFMIVEDYSR
jgi:uncharacterized iron-regulated protein